MFSFCVKSYPATSTAHFLLLNQVLKNNQEIIIPWNYIEKLWVVSFSDTNFVPVFPCSTYICFLAKPRDWRILLGKLFFFGTHWTPLKHTHFPILPLQHFSNKIDTPLQLCSIYLFCLFVFYLPLKRAFDFCFTTSNPFTFLPPKWSYEKIPLMSFLEFTSHYIIIN